MKTIFDFLPSLRNKDEYFQNIAEEKNTFKQITHQYFLLSIFSFIYGISMGSYHSLLQAFTSGVKVWVLFSLALIICYPSFYIIQLILGSKLRLFQMTSIILSGFILTTSIMVSFIPIVVFFLLTGSNYYFLQLLHISIFILSGFFGMKIIMDALRFSCENKNIYPRTGVVIFRFWIIILAFVGIQLAWNLRPFLGDTGQPFKLFRKYEGNFYTALIYSVQQLFNTNDKNSDNEKIINKNKTSTDTLSIYNFDFTKEKK